MEREKSLTRSARWPQAEGSVHQIIWDSSLPREQILYSYSTNNGYFSGFFWRWFEPANAREVRVNDRIVLRYNPENPEESVFLIFRDTDPSVISVASVVVKRG